MPDSHTIPLSKPRTGPIISRPRWDDSKRMRVVRLWIETAQYPTFSTTHLTFKDENSQLLTYQTLRQFNDPLGQSCFWVVDLWLPENASGCIRLFVNADGETLQYPLILNWKIFPWYKRRDNDAKTMSFLIGSCLYPGSPFEQELADSVYAAMRTHAESGEFGVDHLLLVGDQIYADATADLFDPFDLDERFRTRYRRAFGGALKSKGKNAHKLMSHVPTYFALDDHEIVNDWKGISHSERDAIAFTIALREARYFQMHNQKEDTQFWYSFISAGFPFFVLDTRTERSNKARNRFEALIRKHQLDSLDSWFYQLHSQSDHDSEAKPVFIVSGSPIGPVPSDFSQFPELAQHSDTLLGYSGFLKELYKILSKYNAQNVIWLSGDLHLSLVSEVDITLDKNSTIKLTQIVASGLFAPLPFANERPDRYNWNKTSTIDYQDIALSVTTKPYLLSKENSHFVRFDLKNEEKIIISAYNNQNSQLGSIQIEYNGTSWRVSSNHEKGENIKKVT